MADDVVYAQNPPLLTLKGLVTVHYLDGDVIEGNFATQDAYNVFLNIDDEPVMIPRSQIRFIRGNVGQQIERDTSLTTLPEAEPTQPVPEPIEPSPEPDAKPAVPQTTQEYTLESFPQDDDSTLVLYPDDDEEEEEDGTVVLYPDAQPAPPEFDEDEGTVVLPASLADLQADQPESTEADEDDMTVVLDESERIADEEDATVMLPEPEAAEPSALLTCIGGPHAGETLNLSSGIVTLGRSADNVLVLSSDKEISRHHAIILLESGQFVVQDQNSLNGTYVNDELITAPHYLQHGDEILVGVTRLRFERDP